MAQPRSMGSSRIPLGGGMRDEPKDRLRWRPGTNKCHETQALRRITSVFAVCWLENAEV